jgi:hypothetical protein
MIAQHPDTAQIHRARAAQAAAPVVGHLGDGLGCARQGARQAVLDAAMDHALAGQRLP